MKAPENLRQLQTAMKERMTGAPALHLALAIAQTPGGPSAEERLSVYSDGWFWRLEESLRDDYEGFFATMTKPEAETLCRSYLKAYPSSSYTLAHLGDQLPKFLRESANSIPWAIELCDVERSFYLAGLSRDPVVWSPDSLATMSEDEMENLRLMLSPSAFLHALEYDVRAWLSGNAPNQSPQKCSLYVAVHRQGFDTLLTELSKEHFDFLEAFRGGVTLGELADRSTDEAWPTWLQELASGGLIEIQT